MKKSTLAILATVTTFLAAAHAEDTRNPPPVFTTPPPPPQFRPAPPPTSAPPLTYVYDQKPLAGMPELIPLAQAQAIINQFRTNYAKPGSPRILIYVNRELVDEPAGLKLSSRSKEVTTTTNTAPDNKASVTTQTVTKNQYVNQSKAEPTIADRQTVRDVERLMSRPLRAAGANLVDEHLAAGVIHGRPLDSLTGETPQAQRDRNTVRKLTEIVVEVLMSSRNVTVAEVSGDKTYAVPDIQMTAIRLLDARVVGRAAASEVINKAGGVSYAARNFDVQAVTEATTLALMDNMLQEAK